MKIIDRYRIVVGVPQDAGEIADIVGEDLLSFARWRAGVDSLTAHRLRDVFQASWDGQKVHYILAGLREDCGEDWFLANDEFEAVWGTMRLVREIHRCGGSLEFLAHRLREEFYSSGDARDLDKILEDVTKITSWAHPQDRHVEAALGHYLREVADSIRWRRRRR